MLLTHTLLLYFPLSAIQSWDLLLFFLFVLYWAWRSHLSSGLQLARTFLVKCKCVTVCRFIGAKVFCQCSVLWCHPGFSRKGCTLCGAPTARLPGAGGDCTRGGIQHFGCKTEVFVLKTTILKNFHFTNKCLGDLVQCQVRMWANLESCHVLILSPSLSGACYTRHDAEKGQACLCRCASDLRRPNKRVGEQHCYSHRALRGSSLPGKAAWFLLLNCSVCCCEKLFAALLTQELGRSLREDALQLPTEKISFSLPVTLKTGQQWPK